MQYELVFYKKRGFVMLRYIRSVFCHHEFIKTCEDSYVEGKVVVYMCKHCGWIRKMKTF